MHVRFGMISVSAVQKVNRVQEPCGPLRSVGKHQPTAFVAVAPLPGPVVDLEEPVMVDRVTSSLLEPNFELQPGLFGLTDYSRNGLRFRHDHGFREHLG